jgi:hypothetical protein
MQLTQMRVKTWVQGKRDGTNWRRTMSFKFQACHHSTLDIAVSFTTSGLVVDVRRNEKVLYVGVTSHPRF